MSTISAAVEKTPAATTALGDRERVEEARIVHLDGWRGLAMVLVMITHFMPLDALDVGKFGLEMFFVLSGRLMAEILFINRFPILLYYYRRFSRILPAAWFFAFVCYLLFSERTDQLRTTFEAFLSAIGFYTNYYAMFAERTYSLGHFWSLSVEEHTYILLGVLAMLARRFTIDISRILGFLAFAAILAGAWNWTLWRIEFGREGWVNDFVYWRSEIRGASILLGAFVYLHLRKRGQYLEVDGDKPESRLPLVLFALALMTHLNVLPEPVRYAFGTPLLAVSMALVHRSPRRILRWLEHPFFVRIGLWSFSIYLWQQVFYRMKKMHWAPGWVLMLCAFAVGIAMFYLIEQPARSFLKRRFGRHHVSMETAVATRTGA